MKELLVCRDLCAGYGRIAVLNRLSLSVPGQQVLGVIGPNGSGKTTLLNVLSGLILPTGGTILLNGKEITRLSPDARCRLGLGRTFQIPRPFEHMTVFENVLAAAAFGSGGSRPQAWDAALRALAFTHLSEKKDFLSGRLMLLDRKRLEIARAVSGGARLLLLDEIAAGLTGAEVAEIIQIVLDLKAAGYTVIWIEHMIDAMFRAADELICMAEGQVVMQGRPAEVLGSEIVSRLYLGNIWEGTSNAVGRKPAGEV